MDGSPDHLLQRGCFFVRKLLQDIIHGSSQWRGLADTDPYARKSGFSELLQDGLYAAVPGAAASSFDSQLSKRYIHIVMDNGDVCRGNVIVCRTCCHGFTAAVHECQRLCDYRCTGPYAPDAAGSLESFLTQDYAAFTGKLIDGTKTDVVPRMAVFRARIAQADDQSHPARVP